MKDTGPMLIYYIYHGRVSPLNHGSAARLIETGVIQNELDDKEHNKMKKLR